MHTYTYNFICVTITLHKINPCDAYDTYLLDGTVYS